VNALDKFVIGVSYDERRVSRARRPTATCMTPCGRPGGVRARAGSAVAVGRVPSGLTSALTVAPVREEVVKRPPEPRRYDRLTGSVKRLPHCRLEV
jgi:hypothetical protein